MFIDYFNKIFTRVDEDETTDVKKRVNLLKNDLRKVIYTMVSRGMFERHKLVFLTQLTIRLMAKNKLNVKEDYDLKKILFLLIGGSGQELSPIEWLDTKSWNMCVKLSEITGFEKLTEDLAKTYASKFKE